LGRIEDQLWPGGAKKVKWHDIELNARSNARFAWLPPKGLDGLKRIACQQARWRDTADGFVERGPFEKAPTTVSVSRLSYIRRAAKRALKSRPWTPALNP
jgi:hypothetical protein